LKRFRWIPGLFSLYICLISASTAHAQSASGTHYTQQGSTAENRATDYPKLAIEFRGGVTAPRIAARGSKGLWEPGKFGAFGIGFGMRPVRYLQLDAGVDAVLQAFGASGSINTTGGRRDITDREVLVTLGPRVVLPLATERVLASLGAGYAYAHYSGIAQAHANEVIVGFNGDARSGHGTYLFGMVEIIPTRTSPFTIGVRVGSVRASTDGDPVGRLPGVESHDRWPTVVGTFLVPVPAVSTRSSAGSQRRLNEDAEGRPIQGVDMRSRTRHEVAMCTIAQKYTVRRYRRSQEAASRAGVTNRERTRERLAIRAGWTGNAMSQEEGKRVTTAAFLSRGDPGEVKGPTAEGPMLRPGRTRPDAMRVGTSDVTRQRGVTTLCAGRWS
jgi:hypothetical protein